MAGSVPQPACCQLGLERNWATYNQDVLVRVTETTAHFNSAAFHDANRRGGIAEDAIQERCPVGASAVNLAAMADLDHQHKEDPVPDFVEHPVVTYADPVVVGIARKLFATCRPGMGLEASDRVCHPDSDLRGKLKELSLGGRK